MQKTLGFSLIEIMIALGIMAIVISLSYPTYSHYLVQVRRAEAREWLMQLANAMEKYHLEHDTYRDATLTAVSLPTLIANKQYQLIIAATSDTDYTLKAKPQGHQATLDTACSTLILTSTGEKKSTGTADPSICW